MVYYKRGQSGNVKRNCPRGENFAKGSNIVKNVTVITDGDELL